MSATPVDLRSALRAAVDRRGPDWPSHALATATLAAYASNDLPAPDPGRMAALIRRFGLSPGQGEILQVAMLAESDPGLHLLCGLLAGDDGADRPTAGLAAELLLTHPDSVRTELGASAPLRRHGLITLDGNGPMLSRRLRVADRVVGSLCGDELPDPLLLPLLVDPVPVSTPAGQQVEAALRHGHGLVWIHAAAGTAGVGVAADACRILDVPCLTVDLRRLPTVSDSTREMSAVDLDKVAAAAVLEAALSGTVLIVQAAEWAAASMHRFDSCPVPVLLVGGRAWDPWWTSRLPICVSAPRIGPDERTTVWWPLLGGRDPGPEIGALRLAPDDIVLAGRHAQDMAALAGDDTSVQVLRDAARRLGRSHSGRSVSQSSATMDDLVLPEHARADVVRLLDWARHRDEVLAQGPLQGKGGKGSGICALFSGSPGTGKTLAAHVVADTLGMELLCVELSTVVDKYIGETEKNLERIFTEAEALNAVLFFDEADALFGSRSEVKDSRDRYANQEVAYLLQRMEVFDGITILATNLRGNLDPAFARRLHFMVHFPDPDPPTRAELWRHHLAPLRTLDPDDPVDIGALAQTVELAGGEIRNIVLAAAYAAAAQGRPVGMRHLLDSTAREYTKLGRRIPSRPLFSTPSVSTTAVSTTPVSTTAASTTAASTAAASTAAVSTTAVSTSAVSTSAVSSTNGAPG